MSNYYITEIGSAPDGTRLISIRDNNTGKNTVMSTFDFYRIVCRMIPLSSSLADLLGHSHLSGVTSVDPDDTYIVCGGHGAVPC